MPAPSKIVSLSPTATEMLFAIGAGDQVIAVDDQSNFPAEAAAEAPRSRGFQPNVEAIAALKPDLVLIGDDSSGLSKQLGDLGLSTWVGPAATSFDDIYTQIEQLGAATGHVGEAAELVATMQTEIDAAVQAAPMPSTAAALLPRARQHVLQHHLEHLHRPGVQRCSACRTSPTWKRCATDYPQLSAPRPSSRPNPDLIFLADGDVR